MYVYIYMPAASTHAIEMAPKRTPILPILIPLKEVRGRPRRKKLKQNTPDTLA